MRNSRARMRIAVSLRHPIAETSVPQSERVAKFGELAMCVLPRYPPAPGRDANESRFRPALVQWLASRCTRGSSYCSQDKKYV